ncbi:MAG TPA: hypothetical protein VGR81_00960 [Candidatus Acidoferrales bacterium]|nr:hypothetical protein [Candidatus Acidoferrales bacterium]
MRQANFNTGLRGGLFDAKHYARMGPAIWLYGWFVLRQTRECDGVGLVLGGHPVSYREIESETGFCRKTLERWMHTLRRAGYIETSAASAGVVVRITKAKKFFRAASGKVFHSPVENRFAQSSNLRTESRNFDACAPQTCEEPPQNRGRCGAQQTDARAHAPRIGSGEITEKTNRICTTSSYFHSPQEKKTQNKNPCSEKREEAHGFERIGSDTTIGVLKAEMQRREWRFRRDQREEALRRELRAGAGPQLDRE